MNTDQDHQEIGLLRVLTYKELKQLLLKAMKESTEATWLEWESYLSNSRMVRMQTSLD